MSRSSQWSMFQPETNSMPMQDILDLQHSNIQPKPVDRRGSYTSDYLNSPRDSFNSVGNNSGTNSFSQPMGDSMGVFSSSNTNSSGHYESSTNPPIRETGIIEKLLHSYGFIQCCERQARLFFHFSQFSGNIEHLKIGDPVEFEMTYDRRTGKPIASTVTKIAPEVVLSEARVTGTVTTEVKGGGSGDNTGRISYENRGECFFLPYTKDDVEGKVTLRTGDAVSFQIATNQRGTLGACHIRFENPAHPVQYNGVICSMKENFGFIERADVVKEIFFHFSEAKTKEDLALGDDVEFIIQTRNGKEVACNITKLPSGSVVFEDVSPEVMRGQVIKPLERGNTERNDPLPGRIRYRAADHSEVEVPFGDKDQCGEFTLRHGDWVQFQVAVDRRDQLKRATNISLLDESFSVSGEKREQGVVCALKDGFGFIRCVEREHSIFFYFAEVLRLGQELSVGDEVEFTANPVSSFSNTTNRLSAIRIKHLPPGSVTFETLVERGVRGTITMEAPHANSSPNKSDPETDQMTGTITCTINGNKKNLSYLTQHCESKMLPRVGDKVEFDVYQVKRTKELIAMGIHVQHSLSNGRNSNGNSNNNHRLMMQGFIAALKDGFGFIETADHTKEVFFHFSYLEANLDYMELGSEVEYLLGRYNASNSGCASAEYVRLLPPGTIPVAKPLEPVLNGTVTRTLRALNPDQSEYSGSIQAEDEMCYDFGIMGLSSKREILQVGDAVTFQVDEEGRACNIVPSRNKRRAAVDAIKGGFGFLSLEGEDSRRLFFHMSEVRGNPSELQPGDMVEFVLLTNPRNGKSSACNVVRISGKAPRVACNKLSATGARPERLLARFRATSLEETAGPRVQALRPPRGPDGTKGFLPRRPVSGWCN